MTVHILRVKESTLFKSFVPIKSTTKPRGVLFWFLNAAPEGSRRPEFELEAPGVSPSRY